MISAWYLFIPIVFDYFSTFSFTGSHDLLYQEFLPLLPNLLQGNFREGSIYSVVLDVHVI